MELNNLKENSLNKIQNTLKDLFDYDINLNLNHDKLQAVLESTKKRISEIKDNGVDSSDPTLQKLMLIREGLELSTQEKLMETQDLDQAEVLLAAKQMADDLQKMAENLASMQVEDLMSITNAMKEEVGTAEAEQFNITAEQAINGALEAVKSANDQINNAVLAAQGQPVETDMDMDQAMDMPADDIDIEDDFGGADSADDTSDEMGREMKEDAYLQAIKMIKEAQTNGKVSSDLLKKAFAVVKRAK